MSLLTSDGASSPGPDGEARGALGWWASLVEGSRLTALPRATNPLWRVDGPGPRLVLKQLPEHPPGVAPVVEFRVLSHLQRQGVPVALPLLTDRGTLHATVAGRRWVLLPHLPHGSGNHELGPDPAGAATAVGAAIGRLDRALAAYPWPVDSFVDDPVSTLSRALPELPAEAVRRVEPLTDLLLQTCAGLPAQLTHGDCNDGNVLVDQGRVTGFVDVDHLPAGPRVRDLAYYLASRLRRHLTGPQASEAATSALLAVVGDYVAGYHQTYPLTDQERSAVVPLMLVVEIGGAHWALHGWQPDATSYQRSLRSIAWVVDHLDALAASVRTP